LPGSGERPDQNAVRVFVQPIQFDGAASRSDRYRMISGRGCEGREFDRCTAGE
jgi:hypothetical protein